MQTTGNLGLKKPEGTDIVDIADLNGNMDILDNAVNSKVDKASGKQLSTNDYTTAEKTKLAGIATGATNYTHPATHPAAIIAQDASNRFVTDAEKTAWNAKAGTAVATTATNGLMSAADKTLLNNNTGFGTTAGTATAYTLTLSPAPTVLIAGLKFSFKTHIASGANPTLNPNTLGAKAIKKPNGNAATLALNGVYTVVYDGTAFILQGEGGDYGTATAADVLAGKTIGTEGGLATGTIPLKNTANGVTGGSAGILDYHDAASASIGPAAHNDSTSALFMQILPTGVNRLAVDRGVFFRVKESNLVPANYLKGKPMFGVDGAIPNLSGQGMKHYQEAIYRIGQLPEDTSQGYVEIHPNFSGYVTPTSTIGIAMNGLHPSNIRAGVAMGNPNGGKYILGTLKPSMANFAQINQGMIYTTETKTLVTIPPGVTFAALSGGVFSFIGQGFNDTFSFRVWLQDNVGNVLYIFYGDFTSGQFWDQMASGFIVNAPANTIKFPRQSMYQPGFGTNDIDPETGTFSKPFNISSGFSIVASINVPSPGSRASLAMRGDLIWC